MIRTITEVKSGKIFSYSMSHTKHSKYRAAQRGFSENDLLNALDFSEVIRKQGLYFYIVVNSRIPSSLPEKRKKKILNMVVVVSGDEDSIITCYKAKNNFKHIKKKNNLLK
jgi:hypothetical protein